jgi:hypothetical protein
MTRIKEWEASGDDAASHIWSIRPGRAFFPGFSAAFGAAWEATHVADRPDNRFGSGAGRHRWFRGDH